MGSPFPDRSYVKSLKPYRLNNGLFHLLNFQTSSPCSIRNVVVEFSFVLFVISHERGLVNLYLK